MKHKKRKKLYLLPALSVLVVAICLMMGGWYIRSYIAVVNKNWTRSLRKCT